jgi:WD40 repeat protein
LLGWGSFANVYLGEHLYLKRQVAIKVLRTRLGNEDTESFLTEARTIADLEHPHIVRVFDCGIDNGTPFLIMSYAPNGTLRKRHPEGIPLAPTVILPYVKQVAAALQYAHDRKLIHRDVKPANMLLSQNNEVWLSDFGLVLIAQSTISHVTKDDSGTPTYMAPEQFMGKLRPASDQYALGIVVYEWLCGELPFHGSRYELFSQHNNATPPPMHEKVPAISPAVETVVLKALEKDPYKRFANVKDFAAALEQACKAEPYLLPPSAFDLWSPSPLEERPIIAPAAPALISPYTSTPTPHIAGEHTLPARAVPSPEALPTPDPIARYKDANSSINPNSRWPGPPVTPVPGILAPSQAQGEPGRKFSRRAVVVGLIGAVVVVSSGAGVLMWEQASKGSTNAQSPTPAHPLKKQGPTATHTSSSSSVGVTIYTYRKHTDGVRAALWSPNGQFIASASLDKTVHVWNATTGKDILPPYSRHSKPLKTVAWSPNGHYIASGGEDKTVHVWNAATGNDLPFSPYKGHSETVRNVTWSPRGQFIASASEDHTVQVWNGNTGDLRVTYRGHSFFVISAAWSPDGKYIASASFDKTVQVWDASTGGIPVKYLRHASEVRAVAWSLDGRFIASGGNDDTVHLWEATTGHLIRLFKGHTGFVQSIAWSPDGKYIASGSFDTTVRIWNAATGENVFTYHHHSSQVWSVAWSPHGRFIASGAINNDNTVQIWQAV